MTTDRDQMEAGWTESPRESEYRRARERAEMLQGLYIHLLVFAVVNAGLFVINVLTRGDDGGWWFQWPLLAWGVGLAVHVVVTISPVFTSDWADRKARQIMDDQHSG